MGYGSDKWWRVQVIVMFMATVLILVLGTYNYINSPLRFESSILDTVILQESESTDTLCIELLFSNVGTQRIVVSNVSLRLARYDPPRWKLIPGYLSPEVASGRGLVLPAGKRERSVVQFPVERDDVLEGLGIGQSGHYVIEGSLLVTFVDRRGSEGKITIGGLSVIVDHGTFCEMNSGDAIVRYAGG
jgi:hypothetical protein